MTTLAVGDLVARVEAPAMFYRVTSVSSGVARCLPFRRSGREVFVVKIGDAWAGDGSAWRRAGTDGGRAEGRGTDGGRAGKTRS